MPPNSPTARALDDPHTRRALTKYTVRVVSMTVLGVGLGLGLIAILVPHLTGSDERAVGTVLAFPVVAVSIGLGGVRNLTRVRKVMAYYRWTQVDVRAEPSSFNGLPTLHLSSGDTHWDLYPSTAKWNWGRFQKATLMFAGELGEPGAIATPDGLSIAWGAKPSRLWGPSN